MPSSSSGLLDSTEAVSFPKPTSAKDSNFFDPNAMMTESPFHRYFDTNYAPTGDEIMELNKIVASSQIAADKLKHQIDTLHEQISFLTEQMLPLLHSVKQHKALAHPIRRLPAEILQSVFINCAPTDNPGSMHVEDCPLALTVICRFWREVAVNTPELWTTLHIPLPAPNLVDAREIAVSRALGAQQWLSRSGCKPLSIAVIQIPDREGIPHGHYYPINDIFPVLQSQFHRLKKLHLSMSWDTVRAFVNLPPSGYPILESLTVRIADDAWLGAPLDDQWTRDLQAAGFFQSPALKELFLHALPPDTSLSGLSVTWSRLTSLTFDVDLTTVPPPGLYGTLAMAQCLQNLRLSLCAWRGHQMDDPPHDDVTLPLLKKLTVFERVPFPSFGRTLRFPALEDLEYYDGCTDTWSSIHLTPTGPSSLSSIVSHSGGGIRHLIFNPCSYSVIAITQILLHCPQLRSLVLSEPSREGALPALEWKTGDSSFLFSLRAAPLGQGPTTVCPRLNSLIIDRPSDIRPHTVLQWLKETQSRASSHVAALERMVMHFSEVEDSKITEEIEGMFEGGKRSCVLRYADAPMKSSVRDGTEQLRAASGGWGSFSYDKYFGTLVA